MSIVVNLLTIAKMIIILNALYQFYYFRNEESVLKAWLRWKETSAPQSDDVNEYLSSRKAIGVSYHVPLKEVNTHYIYIYIFVMKIHIFVFKPITRQYLDDETLGMTTQSIGPTSLCR